MAASKDLLVDKRYLVGCWSICAIQSIGAAALSGGSGTGILSAERYEQTKTRPPWDRGTTEGKGNHVQALKAELYALYVL